MNRMEVMNLSIKVGTTFEIYDPSASNRGFKDGAVLKVVEYVAELDIYQVEGEARFGHDNLTSWVKGVDLSKYLHFGKI